MSQQPKVQSSQSARVLTARWPLKTQLTAIRADLGSPGTTGTPGGSPSINDYAGYPFYYHVVASSTGSPGSVDILINETGPSDSTAKGPINSVTLTYTIMSPPPNPHPITQQMKYKSPGGEYRGEHLHLCIDFSDDLTTGTLIIDRARHEGEVDYSRVGILVVSKDYSASQTTRGHFVVVPVTADASNNFPTTASIHFPGQLGSFAGPVGGGQVP